MAEQRPHADEAFSVDQCDQALTDIMAARRYEMTPFEARAWTKVINAVEPRRFIAFVSHHYASSPFAPTPADATKFLDLGINPEVSFARLERLVKECGPYKAPSVPDPVLHTAIELMGGWAKVNEDLPDSRESFEYKRFRERFDASFTEATVKVRINNEAPTKPLLAIGGRAQELLGNSVTAPPAAASNFIQHERAQ